jgi:hypothetical protein
LADREKLKVSPRALDWKHRASRLLKTLPQGDRAFEFAMSLRQLSRSLWLKRRAGKTLSTWRLRLGRLSGGRWKQIAAVEKRLLFFLANLPPQPGFDQQAFAPGDRWALARRGDALIAVRLGAKDAAFLYGGPLETIAADIVVGNIKRLLVKSYADVGVPIAHPAGETLLRSILLSPETSRERTPSFVSAGRTSAGKALSAGDRYEAVTDLLAKRPDLVDLAAAQSAEASDWSTVVPFDQTDFLPRLIPAEPKRRSALFLHHSYYHFNCLADGLRRRGWDAMTVSLESPDSPHQQFYHGQDLSLFDPDPKVMRDKIRDFFRTIPERFGSMHFYGMGYASFFPDLFENQARPILPPFDFFELRRHGMVIGYMPSGCLDGAPQSAIRTLSGNICARCVWESNPRVCSDARSVAWGKRLERVCDWIGIEGDWPAGPRIGEKYVHGPVVTTLDTEAWRPDLVVPDDLRVQRKPNTLLVYHAVGNYASRRVGDRDIKGTGAVMAAIDKLKAEGLPVELYFATNVPSRIVRFIQVQADIVIDQLNYGRIGANARESMMLGRPVMIRLDPRQGASLPPLRQVQEAPMVDATEQNVADVLRELLQNPKRRAELGKRAREFAVAWHGAEACAERYEKVIDRIRAGLKPDSPDLYPAAQLQ